MPKTRHGWECPLPDCPEASPQFKHLSKEDLRRVIGDMQASGMSYREIGMALSIHWTRVEQVLRQMLQ
ncbi:MAG: hypothetical protein IPK19_21440 [Chloroflexi bacterium]|nr:hypothetical protein [Chloroflexota bacterium]